MTASPFDHNLGSYGVSNDGCSIRKPCEVLPIRMGKPNCNTAAFNTAKERIDTLLENLI